MRLIDWLIGCSIQDPDPTWQKVLISAFRCVVRFSLVIALLYALYHMGYGLIDGL